MSSESRRRKLGSDELSDEGSDVEQQPKVIPKNASDGEAGQSEYESVDEEEEAGIVEHEVDDLAEDGELDEEGDEVPETNEEDESKDLANKRLDDDEDRKNPQYIPKKGTFYEHDDRTMSDEEKPKEEETSKKDPKKKIWKESDTWHHDRYEKFDQGPKSKDELVELYGYDIRNEDGPPKARRRRRYGRGPNKYTRKWEDYDAYSKLGVRDPRIRRGRGRGQNLPLDLDAHNEFPTLEDTIPTGKDNSVDAYHVKIEEAYNSSGNRGKPLPYSSRRGNLDYANTYNTAQEKNVSVRSRTIRGRGRYSNMRHEEIVPKSPRDSKANIRPIQSQNSIIAKDVEGTSDKLASSLQIKDTLPVIRSKGKPTNENKKNIPPRLQDSAAQAANRMNADNSSSRPKRYSSQRQRSVPEQNMPQYSQQGYYETSVEPGFQRHIYDNSSHNNAAAVTVPLSQLTITPAPANFVPPAFTSPPTYTPEPFLGRTPAPRMFPPATQGPPHIIASPVAPVATPVPGPQAVSAAVPGTVSAPVSGPAFLPPDSMINYAAPHPAATQFPTPHPPPHPQQYTAFQGFTAVSQPQEIYSNGVMYYNTQSQQLAARNGALLKRPKAAIPIVPPPEKSYSRCYHSADNMEELENYYDEELSDEQDIYEDDTIEAHSEEDHEENSQQSLELYEEDISESQEFQESISVSPSKEDRTDYIKEEEDVCETEDLENRDKEEIIFEEDLQNRDKEIIFEEDSLQNADELKNTTGEEDAT